MLIMKSRMLGALLVAATLLAGCNDHAQATPPKAVSYTTPSICHFSASSSGTKYLSIGAPNTLGCGFELDQNNAQKYSLGMASSGITILSNISNDNINSAGFSKNKESELIYTGLKEFLLNPKIIHLSTTRLGHKGDITLVGVQLMSGNGQSGGKFLVHGVSVLRLTTGFGVRSHFMFAPRTPKPIRDAVENDLIKIVDSVEPVSASSTVAPASSAPPAASK